MQENQIQSLGRDPLEEEMATHSSILTWEIPWTEEPGRLQPMESQRVGDDWVTNTHTSFDNMRLTNPTWLCIFNYRGKLGAKAETLYHE